MPEIIVPPINLTVDTPEADEVSPPEEESGPPIEEVPVVIAATTIGEEDPAKE